MHFKSAQTGRNRDDVKHLYALGDEYCPAMSAKEALEFGLLDDIITTADELLQ